MISILSKQTDDPTTPKEIRIKTSWGDELLEHGGLLTDENYCISKTEYHTTYDAVNGKNTTSSSINKTPFFKETKGHASPINYQENLETRDDDYLTLAFANKTRN